MQFLGRHGLSHNGCSIGMVEGAQACLQESRRRSPCGVDRVQPSGMGGRGVVQERWHLRCRECGAGVIALKVCTDE